MTTTRQQTVSRPASTYMPAPNGLLQRQCACGTHTAGGGECAECSKKKLQRKLSIGATDDLLELEADRVADQVMAAPAHPVVNGTPPRIQRFSGHSNGQLDAAPSSVGHALASPGRPLEPVLRQDMGQRFGYDFSRVRVHSGAGAEQSARQVSAHAYTVGSDIVFETGRFAPGAHEGRHLLAHELMHVVQHPGAHGNSFGQNNEVRELPPVTVFTKIRVFPPDRTNRFEAPSPLIAPRLPSPIQANLVVGQVNDPLEYEADRVAKQMVRISEPQSYQTQQADDEHKRLQTKHVGSIDSGQILASLSVRELLRFAGEEHETNRIEILDGKETLADWLPQTRGTVAERTMVHPASPVADRDGAHAVTVGRMVHLSSGISRLEPAEQQQVLAHEAVHVAQHSAPGPSAPREILELEAHQLSPQVLSGRAVQPQYHADAMMALAEDGGPLPNDIIAVRKAKARREVLLRYKAVYEGSKNTNLAAERQDILEKRERLDDSMSKNLLESEKYTGTKSRKVEEYREQERKNLAVLNKKPVTLEVTTTTVRIRVRFQVRFEGLADKDAAKRFPVLKQNFEKGVRDIWNQKLKGAVLPGRTFEMMAELHFVSRTAARDEKFWLITVRPTDKGPMVYEKTSLGQAPGGVPTSATNPTVGAGVMSIPPSHIEKPDILGHETLHLFGMVDRYLTLPKLGEFGLRDTKGRQDPLGADEETGDVKGKILEEDLGFVLDQFGVYPTIPYNDVLAELKQVEEIIRTGRDPTSLIEKRKDFTPEMIKQAEDLE